MQIAAQAAALLFASGDKLGTRLLEVACQALEIRGEPQRVGRYPSLACQIREQRTISRCEELPRPTGSKHQFTDQLALIAERKMEQFVHSFPKSRRIDNCTILLPGNSSIGEFQG